MDKPLVNSWTEFGDLEYICVGTARGAQYPNSDPFDAYRHNVVRDKHLANYIVQPLGPRPVERELRAEKELDYLREILESEQVTVASLTEFDDDIKMDLRRKRSYANPPKTVEEDKRVHKPKAGVCKAPAEKFDHLLITPWFKNYYQFGVACPRDAVITLGNTILETPTAARTRYFESSYFRDIIYSYWNADKRIHWKTAPQPTCRDSMYNFQHAAPKTTNGKMCFDTPLSEKEVAFDVADMMRIGKDVFYKKSGSANYKGLEWLRREFPNLRFHLMRFPTDLSPHMDVNMIPMRPPTSGSEGVMLLNQNHLPLEQDVTIFTENDWKPVLAPLPVTSEVSPVAICSPNLNVNLLSITPKCCVIEECEIPLYHFLEDLGFDVITCPLRALNEFGGGVHCVTWDIRRDDACTDYFPRQNYEEECNTDFNKIIPKKWSPPTSTSVN